MIESAALRTPAELADLFNRAFAGYFVPVEFSAESFLARARYDLIDLGRSLVAGDEGILLLSPVGDAVRVAGMGVVPAARRTGLGRRLLEEGLARGAEPRWELEVIEENHGARALYERLGFEAIERLVGHRAEDPAAQADPSLGVVDAAEFARAVARHGDADLPWQCAAPSLSTVGHPARAHRLGPASVLLQDPEVEEIRILAVLCEPAARGRGHASRLLRAVFARYPGRRWLMPPCAPERFAPFFAGLGFAPHPIAQWRMRREFAGGELAVAGAVSSLDGGAP